MQYSKYTQKEKEKKKKEKRKEKKRKEKKMKYHKWIKNSSKKDLEDSEIIQEQYNNKY